MRFCHGEVQMRYGLVGVLVLLLAAAAGCRGQEEVPEGRPLWVKGQSENDLSDRLISAVGVAAPDTEAPDIMQKAESEARAQLARELDAYVRAEVSKFLQAHRDYADPSSSTAESFTTVVSAEVANAMLRHSVRYDTWQEGPDGNLYVLYRVPVALVNEQIVDKTRVALRHVDPFTGAAEEQVIGDFKEFLESELVRTAAREAPEENADPEGTPSGQSPQWVLLGRHDEHPDGEFITAMGIGEDRLAAEDSALMELAGLIEMRMAGRFTSLTESRSELALTRDLRAVSVDSLGFGRGNLVAARVPETWYEEVTDTCYALAVLHRETAASAYRARIERALKSGKDLFASARNHHRADNYETALRDYLEALRRLQEAARFQLATMVIVPTRTADVAAMSEEATLALVKDGVRGLLGEFSITKVSGDDQWTAPGVSLRAPLVVRLTAGQEAKPLREIPLRFRFASGGGELEEKVTSGPDGAAECTVRRVEGPSRSVGSIACELALGQMAEEGDVSGISPPSVAFRYVVRTKANTRFALCVDETDLAGVPTASRQAEEGLRTALARAGFDLVEQARVRDILKTHSVQPAASDADLLLAFTALSEGMEGKGFLLVIAGRVESRLVERTETSKGELCFAHAPIALRVVDRSLPQRPTALEVSAVGMAALLDDPDGAARQARLRAVELSSEKLVGGLNEKFGVQ